jgi:hypothetical protein
VFRIHARLREATLVLAVLLAAASARSAGLELSGGGVLPAPADGRRIGTGWTAGLAVRWPAGGTTTPRLVLSQSVSRSAGERLYFFPPSPVGTLEPYRDDPDVIRTTALEGAMRHEWRTMGGHGRVFVEGRCGLAWLGWHAVHLAPTNDRRPDPSATVHRAHGLGATTSVGAGFALDLSRRLALGFEGAACSITTDGVAQPQFPVRGALSWSSSAPPSATNPGPHAPRFSLGAGTAWLSQPSGLRDGVRPNLDWSVALEIPWSSNVSIILAGEHEVFTSRERFVLRQESDQFGNVIDVHADATPSWALTTFQCGLELQRGFRAWSPYARVAAGLARTGGQGLTTVDRALVVGPGGVLLISETGHRIGFGDSRVGLTGGLVLGARHSLNGSLAVFAEGGAQGIGFNRDDVLTFPLRAGCVFR